MMSTKSMDQRIKTLQNSIEEKIEQSESLHDEIIEENYPRKKVIEHNELLISVCDDLEKLYELQSNDSH